MNIQVSHHLLLCTATPKSSCCNQKQSIESWESLKSILRKLNLEDPNRSAGIVMRSKVDCLRICNSGPILLIWPEGIWYQNVSPSRIEVIIKSHIIEGIPIKEWIFKETPLKFPITRLMNNSC